jgi:transposase-like protein
MLDRLEKKLITAARCFPDRAIDNNGIPARINIDGGHSNRADMV